MAARNLCSIGGIRPTTLGCCRCPKSLSCILVITSFAHGRSKTSHCISFSPRARSRVSLAGTAWIGFPLGGIGSASVRWSLYEAAPFLNCLFVMRRTVHFTGIATTCTLPQTVVGECLSCTPGFLGCLTRLRHHSRKVVMRCFSCSYSGRIVTCLTLRVLQIGTCPQYAKALSRK